MESNLWDFTKLPKSKHKEVIRFFNNNDISNLILIHDKYNLSFHVYCCGKNDRDSVYRWYKWAIDKKIIHA